MAPTKIECGFPDCEYVTEHESEQVALIQFQSHLSAHQQIQNSSSAAPNKQKLPPIERPILKQDISEEEWDSFLQEWKRFKRCTDIPSDQEADHLFNCCEKGLRRLILKEDPDLINAGEDKLIEAMKKMAVIKVATSIRRTKLLSMKQEPGQSIREFFANTKAQAATCGYSVKCVQECCADAPSVDYTPLVVKDIIICGIADPEIHRDVLELPDLDDKSAKDLVGFIEGKETAKKAWNSGRSSNAAGMSGYKKSNKQDDSNSKFMLKTKCTRCGVQIQQFANNRFGRINKTPFTKCIKCHKETIQEEKTNSMAEHSMNNTETNAAIHGFISTITSLESSDQGNAEYSDSSHVNASKSQDQIALGHHIFSQEGWKRANSLSHPTLRLKISTLKEDYDNLNRSHVEIVPTYIDVVTDSGAQSCLWSRREFLKCGFTLNDLIRVNHRMEAVNMASIEIDGAILLRLTGQNKEGIEIQSAVMVYVSPDAKKFYLSMEAMVQLGIIPNCFPQVGASFPASTECNATNLDIPSPSECDCKSRQPPPKRPDNLPFEAIPENVGKMKEWLFDYYSASTFNKCPHHPIPAMKGPPMKFHIDPDAVPVSRRKPIPVPLHWQEQVEQDLLRDIDLGILERVPHGEPTDWCFPMVVTRKHDGSPRRTIDLSSLNKFCKREAHTSKSPFQMARAVPSHSHKTVLDAWNGFHLVEIREEDRRYTTFATSLGLLRYKRAPQGYLSSGDGFNRRVDDITSHIDRLERCVDDSLLHDDQTDMEGHWWRVIDFLELAGKNGIVINLEKFQFCQSTVDFAGFRISDTSVEPLPKYLDAILQFPTPRNTTDIRSWFGLVNQVSHYAQLRNMLEPFRKFLSPRTQFEWNEQLESAFKKSKDCIVEAIKEGVRIFDMSRRTCLRTDWSKAGIGYFLSQKHCDCKSRTFGCCNDGWRITLAGSRFLTKTESNYAPIEGEALAAAWGLEQTRFFTMGCDDLLVIVDHKPLIKIFGNRRLDEISNPRLFRLKRRTLMWKFDIEYQPGKNNYFSDAVSRNPSKYAEIASASLMNEGDVEEEILIAGIIDEVDKFFAVTWERVKLESKVDKEIVLLKRVIKEGFPTLKKQMPQEITNYWDFRHDLTLIDGVVMYMDRVVIPPKLRWRVTANLHSAHQGTSGMCSRAQSVVFWPGITSDIENARASCRSCHRNAPSQAKLPPTEPRIPKVPFEKIYADYFKLNGKSYLIVGDRLSGWTETFKAKPTSRGSKGLCKALRHVFATFGVPNNLSSDGGPEFSAKATSDFLNRWGVCHTLSSVYFPQSNGRAEVAVRITKRLLEDNIGQDGSLDNDNIVRALLQLRNTPDKESNLSSAEVLFGHQLKDAMPKLDKSVSIFDSPQLHNHWRETWEAREKAIRTRMVRTCERLEQNSKELPPLQLGDTVFIQNQNPAYGKPNKWDREGTIIEVGENDQYLVRVHGTGRVTLRNRRFLRKFTQRSPTIEPCSIPWDSIGQTDNAQQPNLLPAADQNHTPESNASPNAIQAPQAIAPAPLASSPTSPAFTPVPQLSAPTQQTPAPVTQASAPVPCPLLVSDPPAEPAEPRRSSRVRPQRMVYDASTGQQVTPQQ